MQISFWSNMRGQGATSANAAAVASIVAQKTALKTIVAHNHFEHSALESYFFRHSDRFGRDVPGLANQGVDALVRLMRNGRLKPEMVADYTWSLLKDHRLDILPGTAKKERWGAQDEGVLMSILECAKKTYDLVIMDVHSGLSGSGSRRLLESSDVLVFCLNQNRFLLDDFAEVMKNNPFFREKRCVYVISRYLKHAALTPGNLARRYKLDKAALFEIPDNSRFLDALNSGRVFDFIAYYRNARTGEEKEFIDSLNRLCDVVVEGCAKKCRNL